METRLRQSGRAVCVALAPLALLSFLSGCSDAFLEPKSTEAQHLDDRLTLRGQVCTAQPDPRGFPVKVVVVIDQSGSMCVSDPPGSQQAGGFCQFIANGGVPDGGTGPLYRPGIDPVEPARVRALRRLVAQLGTQPNVQLAIVPFETNVSSARVWPPTSTGQRFARPDSSLTTYIGQLQAQLGKGTDYQGALSYAYALISSDITALSASDPAQLPRTRYVVVFLTDGTPFPRCSANDNLPPQDYATPDQPELIWPDALGAGDFCNLLDPDNPDNITGFVPGTDRNQNYQLFAYVDRLMELKAAHNVGDIRLHTVLLFNLEAVRACGPICQDLYGQYPGVPQSQYPEAAKKIASWLLRRFAERGNGVYQEFNDFAGIGQLSLGALDYSSLASRHAMKTLLVQAMSSVPGDEGRLVDSDGDGLPDDLDNDFTFKTNKFFPDTDRDCFDDNFEVLRADRGFDPAEADGRGCTAPQAGCTGRDTDGDGLSQCAEQYLKTHTGLVDSDADGVPDGLEARWGLDPLKRIATGLDTDGDGLPDELELKSDSSPTRRDRVVFDRDGYQYEINAQVQADGRTCYDFTVTNLKLVTPPNRAGVRQGYNLFKVWFAEAPESGVSTDYGVWKTACAWAQYDPPSIREPIGPELLLEDRNFRRPDLLDPTAGSGTPNACVGVGP